MRASPAKGWWAGAAILILCAAFIQRRSGAYSSDLASSPDEPAHVVSGLMVHDYLVRLLRPGSPAMPAGPRAFAEAYYVHYPKVAIGHWPPLFYALQAGWMFLFGRTKAALLLLMLAAVATAAILVWDRTRRMAGGEWAAISAAAIFLLLPVTQQSLFAVMPDAMLALLAAAGIAIFGNAPRRAGWLWAVAVAAVLVHGRGAPLLVLPLAAIALERGANIFKQRGLWIGLAVVLLAVAVLSPAHQTYQITPRGVAAAAAAFPGDALSALGVVPFAMTVCGALVVPYRKQPAWLGITGILLATWLFFSIALVPWDNRYLLLATPASILLMAGAWRWLGMRLAAVARLPGGGLPGRWLPGRWLPSRWLPSRWLPSRWLPSRWIAAILAAGTALTCLHRPLVLPKPNADYEAAAKRVMAEPGMVYLISGTSTCEGAFIAAVDLADHPGRHIVLRSTKVLSASWWLGTHYSLLFRSPEEIAAFLAASPVSVVIVEDTPSVEGLPARPDEEMLRAAIRETPSWRELPPAPHVRIYRRTLPLPPGPAIIRLDMRRELDKYLEWTQ